MTTPRKIQVHGVGRDQHDQPTLTAFVPPTPDNPAGRMSLWVLPITEHEHLELSEAIARSDTGLVDFEIDQARFDMARHAQDVRSPHRWPDEPVAPQVDIVDQREQES